MSSPFLLYFGCWDGAGHFVYDRNKNAVYEERVPAMVLRAEELDASRIFLPWPEQPGVGQLTHLIRGAECMTVLAWWDRTFDKRGKCNAAIQCDGWDTLDGLWHRFSRVYEPLAKQLTKPRLAEQHNEGKAEPQK